YQNLIHEDREYSSSEIKEMHTELLTLKNLCEDLHNNKLYEYAKKAKKELESTISKIESERKLVEKNRSKKIFERNNMRAEQGKEFVLSNGVMLNSISDLIKHLKTMPEEIFVHHVNDERNDFANW